MNAPRPPLLTLDEALPALLARVPLPDVTVHVDTFEADGRVLAQDLVAELQVPAQDNSSMDGYALRCADVGQVGVLLRVTQRIPAGSHGLPLGPGEAARIFTGAPIPTGADAVVMQEDTELQSDERVSIQTVPKPGLWIRRSG
ncbi:MAG: molybdopterin molybdenumtransferase MoeA, partial [Betaproteobacteria bacterium]|nr:molybdopterin molybdenumtransferase MoeA [Betaproteobacteria bacterium]